MTEMVSWVDKEALPDGIVLEDVIIERLISWFADYEGVCGLIEYYGDSPWGSYIAMVANDFTMENPRRPFDTRRSLEADFKDIIMRMMNADPRKRLTAKEALTYKWFADET